MSIVILKSDNLQYNMYTGTLVPSIKQQQQEQTGGSAATMKSKPNEVVAEFFVSLLFVDTLLFWPYLRIWEWEFIFGCAVQASMEVNIHVCRSVVMNCHGKTKSHQLLG